MNSEMADYQEKLKKNIYILIENNRLDEAKELVNQYENIISNDIEVYSIKSVIAIMEGNDEEAEYILTEGLEIQPFNFDILYNLAYLYETNEKYITAYRYYTKALKVIDGEIKESISSKLDELEKIEKVKEYISRKKVLFIAHIFPPVGGSGVQRSLKFVKYLRDFGWEPIVVTVGNTMYPLKDETLVSEIPEEIEIIRIDERMNIDEAYANKLVQIYSGVVNDNGLMEEYIKELNKSQEHLNQLLFQPDTYILWAAEVLDKIDDKVDFEKIDMVYTTSGPYSDHIIGYYLKQKYDKPWVADFRDEWTNNSYVNFNKSSILYRVNFAMENSIVNQADDIITVTSISKQNYEEIFGLKTKKVHEITNGYDEEDFNNLDSKKEKNEKFTIVHNGLLYMIRTPETFLKAIINLIKSGKIIKDRVNVLFPWIENEKQWRKYIMDNDLDDIVKITGYLNHEESLNLAIGSDLLLLVIGKGDENKTVYTGKVFEYLRLCKPILSLSPKESLVEKLIDKTNRGKNFEFDDIEGIEDYIIEMYSKWENGTLPTFQMTEDIKEYERKSLAEKLINVFEKTIKEDCLLSTECKEKNSWLKQHYKEENSDFYNIAYQSGGWNETYFKHYSETHYYEIWLKALELIKKVDKPNIVDIGCGPGQFAKLLLDNGIKDYRGIDFSQEAIKYAKIRNDKNRSLFNVDNAYTTSLFNEEYNTVVIFEVLEHVDEDLKILSRIRAGSTILFSVPNFYSDGHVRWFNSKQKIIERYKKYVEFEDILSFSVGGMNKIFLIKGKVVAKTNSIS